MHSELANTILLFQKGIEVSNRPEDRTLASSYLAALAPLLASAVRGEDILIGLSSLERTFGNTWIIDDEPFKEAFLSWQRFMSEYEKSKLEE